MSGKILEAVEVTTFADKFGHMLTGTGATCLKLCRAESLNVLYLAILCDLSDPFQGSSDLQLEDSKATLYRLVYLNHICVCFRASLLAVWVLVKVSQGSQNLGGLAFCAKIWEAFPS